MLAPLTPQDLGNEAFPYMSVREITVGDVPVRALRVTYVGELGWELYCPDRVRDAALADACGRPASPTAWSPAATGRSTRCGSRRATASGARTSPPTRRPTRAASASASSSTKPGGFIGREALVEAKERGPRFRLCCLALADPRSVALGNEPVRIDGEIRGRVTTGGYGYTVERSIAYAYLPPEHAEPGTAVAVEIFGEWIDGEVAAEPLFDPKGERIRA